MPNRKIDAFQCGGAGKLVVPGKTVPAIIEHVENGYLQVTCPKLGDLIPVKDASGKVLRRKCKINGKPCPYDTRPY